MDNNKKNDTENFRLFYQNQYDRIDKLETKRENFCNYIITISSVLIVLGLTNNSEKISTFSYNLIFIFVSLLNIIAIIFISKTRPFIKMHQKRAEKSLAFFAPKILKIKKQVKKNNSNGDLFRRSLLYSYIHSLIILISIIAILKNTEWICKCLF